MKRIVVSAFLVLGMTVPLATPAQAIFGLSTCEKVKKQVLAYEKQINAISDFWQPYIGKALSQTLKNKLEFQQDAKNDVVVKLIRLQFNNPKCFTRSQNEEINARKAYPWNFGHFVNYNIKTVYKYTDECELTKNSNWSQNCLIRYDYIIYGTYTIPTIYDS